MPTGALPSPTPLSSYPQDVGDAAGLSGRAATAGGERFLHTAGTAIGEGPS